MLNTILLVLDGTLLPMDQGEFISAYFGELAKEAAAIGYEKEPLVKALWKGTRAMMLNDGKIANRECFWDDFAGAMGEQVRKDEPFFDNFYATAFDRARRVVHERRSARPELMALREKGYKLALATNPMFPRVAVERRLTWAGLDAMMFDYMTDYANAHYSKPNPLYYKEILDAMGRKPEEAMMVGNNPYDDMGAKALGMRVFLVTDFIENEKDVDTSALPQGNFEACMKMLSALPKIGAE